MSENRTLPIIFSNISTFRNHSYLLLTHQTRQSLKPRNNWARLPYSLCISRTESEINYSTIEKELLAIIYCIHHFDRTHMDIDFLLSPTINLSHGSVKSKITLQSLWGGKVRGIWLRSYLQTWDLLITTLFRNSRILAVTNSPRYPMVLLSIRNIWNRCRRLKSI